MPAVRSNWRTSLRLLLLLLLLQVLNEAGGIVATLQQLQPQPHEVIVVDGGSSDK
jgi:hypothetical protein